MCPTAIMDGGNLRIKKEEEIKAEEEEGEDQWLLWNAAEVSNVKQEFEVKREEPPADECDLSMQEGAAACARRVEDFKQEPEDEQQVYGRSASGKELEERKRKCRDWGKEEEEMLRIRKMQELASLQREQREEERKLEDMTRGLQLIRRRIEDVTSELLKMREFPRNTGKRPRHSSPPRPMAANVRSPARATPQEAVGRREQVGSEKRPSPGKDAIQLPSYFDPKENGHLFLTLNHATHNRDLPSEFRSQLLRVAPCNGSSIPKGRMPFAVGRGLLEACRLHHRRDRRTWRLNVRCTDVTDRLHVAALPRSLGRALGSLRFRRNPHGFDLPVLRGAFLTPEIYGFRLHRNSDGLCELYEPPPDFMPRAPPSARHGVWHGTVDGEEPRAFVARIKSAISNSCVRLAFFYNCDPGLEGIVGYVVEPDMTAYWRDLEGRHHDCETPHRMTCYWGKARHY